MMVRLNGGRGNLGMTARVSEELNDLDTGDWSEGMMDAAKFLQKRDYSADPTHLQILQQNRPEYVRNFWSAKSDSKYNLLSVAANKLLSAHATTGAAERNWSAWGRTYISLRNRLNIETAEKLVYTKANMPEEWYT